MTATKNQKNEVKPKASAKKEKSSVVVKVPRKSAKKKASAKKASSKVKARNVRTRTRTLTENQKNLLKFISKVKGNLSLKQAGEALGYKNNKFAPMYAYSTMKTLINRGLVQKISISPRKSTYVVV